MVTSRVLFFLVASQVHLFVGALRRDPGPSNDPLMDKLVTLAENAKLLDEMSTAAEDTNVESMKNRGLARRSDSSKTTDETLKENDFATLAMMWHR
mmetsp:Transcript_52984/g.141621  ORF Transcript_52984/g.141621 Transcript_52984/m.141621 type:complete len:96 (+) Transcript_52984:55-342(+)